tara:strand:+ start:752 stop:1963 length:1212 start_codon:yes stop_codon:yes gene_type:complete
MPNWKKIIVSGSDASLTSLNISGNLTASAAYLESASIGHLETIYETASVIYSSGSTKFGDTSDDTHERTGSLFVSGNISIVEGGSLIGTASHALTAITSSHTTGTASFANTATTSSYTLNGDGIFSGSFSGSFVGDASDLNVNPFPFTGSGEMQGKLTIESFNDYIDDYAEQYFAGTALASSGDIALTGSIFSPYINADQFTGSFSGSLSGSFTGSFGGTADSASHSETASYYGGSVTSASLAETASYYGGSVTSASLAETASYYGGTVISASLAETASHVVTASFADMATTASYGFDMTASSLRVEGTASIVYLESVYETSSIIYSSGSTKFGDDTSDTHERTGSVDISGSLTVEGSASLVASQSVNNNTASGSLSFWNGSQTEYNLISASADNNTIYFVTA